MMTMNYFYSHEYEYSYQYRTVDYQVLLVP